MKYDFTTVMDRHGHDAIAWDGPGAQPSGIAPAKPDPGFDLIPMWVADMNFATVPTVQEELIRRVQHPSFGYFAPTREYYESIIRWQRVRNGVEDLKAGMIGFDGGVLSGVISAVNVLCSRGDRILIHTPTYIGFTKTLENNGYRLIRSPLIFGDDKVWRMDFQDMARKIVQYHIHTAVFCSPHNPCGRVWEREELEQMMDLFRRYDVYVVCDEIWSDLTMEGYRHIPLQSVSEDARMRTAAFYSPAKTFNLSGIVGSYHIIYNSWLRDRVRKESSLGAANEMSVLYMHALCGAYRKEGMEWLDELKTVLTGNVRFACGHIRSHYPGVTCAVPQGTYMLFLDCTGWCEAHGKTIDELLAAGWKVGVAWQDGRMFNGPCHIRMNLASPLSRIQEAFRRLDEYVF